MLFSMPTMGRLILVMLFSMSTMLFTGLLFFKWWNAKGHSVRPGVAFRAPPSLRDLLIAPRYPPGLRFLLSVCRA
jgi:hypothetical protein